MYLFLLFFVSGLYCAEKNIEFFQKKLEELSISIEEKNKEIESITADFKIQKIEERKQRIEQRKQKALEIYKSWFFDFTPKEKIEKFDFKLFCFHQDNGEMCFNRDCEKCKNIGNRLQNLNAYILKNQVFDQDEDQTETEVGKEEFLKNICSMGMGIFEFENLFDDDLNFFMNIEQINKLPFLYPNAMAPLFALPALYVLCDLREKEILTVEEIIQYFSRHTFCNEWDAILFNRNFFVKQVKEAVAVEGLKKRESLIHKNHRAKNSKQQVDPFILFQNQIDELSQEIQSTQNQIKEYENSIKQIQKDPEIGKEIDDSLKEINEIIKEFTIKESIQQEELIKRNQKFGLYKRLIFGDAFEDLDQDSVWNFEFQLPRCFHNDNDQLYKQVSKILKIHNQDMLQFSVFNEKINNELLIDNIFLNTWSREFLFPDASHQNFFISEEQINELDNEEQKQLIPVLALSALISLVRSSNNETTKKYILDNKPAKIWRQVLFHKDDLIREIEASKPVLTKFVDKVVESTDPIASETKKTIKKMKMEWSFVTKKFKNNKKKLIGIAAVSIAILFVIMQNKNKIQTMLKNYKNYLPNFLS